MSTNRIAIIGIIVENTDNVEKLNALISEYAPYIVGRMGVPHRSRGVNIMSIAIDAPQDIINALSGQVGKIEGISAKTAYSKMEYSGDDE